jgi:hypothetical protein
MVQATAYFGRKAKTDCEKAKASEPADAYIEREIVISATDKVTSLQCRENSFNYFSIYLFTWQLTFD